MNELITLRFLKLQRHNVPTGKTKHYYGLLERIAVPHPESLVIATYHSDEGFYLLYLDDVGNELTDTFHSSIDEAMAQAEWEFGIKSDEWQVA